MESLNIEGAIKQNDKDTNFNDVKVAKHMICALEIVSVILLYSMFQLYFLLWN